MELVRWSEFVVDTGDVKNFLWFLYSDALYFEAVNKCRHVKWKSWKNCTQTRGVSAFGILMGYNWLSKQLAWDLLYEVI